MREDAIAGFIRFLNDPALRASHEVTVECAPLNPSELTIAYVTCHGYPSADLVVDTEALHAASGPLRREHVRAAWWTREPVRRRSEGGGNRASRARADRANKVDGRHPHRYRVVD